MFFKKSAPVDLSPLLNGLYEMQKQSTQGNALEPLSYTGENEQITEVFEVLNEINNIRVNGFQRTFMSLQNLQTVTKSAFWEVKLFENNLFHKNSETYISNELVNLLQYNRSKHQFNNIEDLVHIVFPEHQSIVQSAIEAHLKDRTGKTPFELKHLMRFGDGNYNWVHTYGEAVRDEHGNPVTMLASIRNINEEENNSRQLSDYMTRYDLIMQVLEEAPWDMEVIHEDPSKNPWWWSDQFRQTLGFTNEADFPNKMESWSNRIHPEDSARVFEAFSNHFQDKTGRTAFSVEYRLQLKSGDYRWFFANGIAKRDDKGNAIRVAGTNRDIHHLKLKEQNVMEMTSRMEELSASITEMVTGVTEIATQAQQLAETQEATKVSANNAKELADETKEVSNFIKGIADQTNLLGLNAAIEAARAGEHGKGFGVVADEVRKLADNSAEATGDIEQRLNQMKDSINLIMEQMTVISDLSQAQAALAEQVNASVDEINNMSQELVEFAKTH